MQETVVIIGRNAWGKGPTVAEAKKEFRKAGGRLTYGYTVLTFDPETEFKGVNHYGDVSYLGNAPQVERHAAS